MTIDGAADPESGFTLIEALCTLTIIALILSVVVPSMLRKPDGVVLEAATRQIAASLRLARTKAITTNAEIVVEIDADKRIIAQQDIPSVQLSSDIALRLTTAREESRGEARAAIRFFPDGTSSGADIVLSLRGRTAKISINWLDGEPKLELAGPQPPALTMPSRL
jgi:general secretion pathway protein H